MPYAACLRSLGSEYRVSLAITTWQFQSCRAAKLYLCEEHTCSCKPVYTAADMHFAGISLLLQLHKREGVLHRQKQFRMRRQKMHLALAAANLLQALQLQKNRHVASKFSVWSFCSCREAVYRCNVHFAPAKMFPVFAAAKVKLSLQNSCFKLRIQICRC